MRRGLMCSAVTCLLLAACEGDERSSGQPAVASTTSAVSLSARAADGDAGPLLDVAEGPKPPPGWRPALGDRVLVRFVDTSWYEATIVEVKPEKRKARVRWRAGSGEDRDVPLVDLAPLHTGVEAPGLALARPPSPAVPWLPVRVIVVAEAMAEVEDRGGERRRLRRSDLVAVP